MKKALCHFSLTDIITNDTRRMRFQSLLIYGAFCAVALVMSLINILSRQTVLLIATASFSALCAVNFVLARHSVKGQSISSGLFMAEVIVLFTYFLITGGTQNFSVVWLLLLPTLGLLFFGKFKGSLMCGIIFVIMLCCFHLPVLSTLVTDYGPTWRSRFPVVYVCSYVVALLLEIVRDITSRELGVMRVKYEQLYSHDQLTGIYNRYGLEEVLRKLNDVRGRHIGVLMFDIDFFKKVNDTYGHKSGDCILRQLAELAGQSLPEGAEIFRWGGEEFVILYSHGGDAQAHAVSLLESVRRHSFSIVDGNVHVTISIGLALANDSSLSDVYEKLLELADSCLYKAKASGRDRIVTDTLNPGEERR